jgi:Protein of unknown function (DUF4233)
MRVMASAVLVFEAIAVALAIPVAITVSGVDATRAGWVGGLLAVSCLLAAGLLRSRRGYLLGSALQVAVVLAGFAVPAMFVVGGVFAALWVLALWLGSRPAPIAGG